MNDSFNNIQASIESLPPEIIEKILKYINSQDLVSSVMQVNKMYQDLSASIVSRRITNLEEHVLKESGMELLKVKMPVNGRGDEHSNNLLFYFENHYLRSDEFQLTVEKTNLTDPFFSCKEPSNTTEWEDEGVDFFKRYKFMHCHNIMILHEPHGFGYYKIDDFVNGIFYDGLKPNMNLSSTDHPLVEFSIYDDHFIYQESGRRVIVLVKVESIDWDELKIELKPLKRIYLPYCAERNIIYKNLIFFAPKHGNHIGVYNIEHDDLRVNGLGYLEPKEQTQKYELSEIFLLNHLVVICFEKSLLHNRMYTVFNGNTDEYNLSLEADFTSQVRKNVNLRHYFDETFDLGDNEKLMKYMTVWNNALIIHFRHVLPCDECSLKESGIRYHLCQKLVVARLLKTLELEDLDSLESFRKVVGGYEIIDMRGGIFGPLVGIGSIFQTDNNDLIEKNITRNIGYLFNLHFVQCRGRETKRAPIQLGYQVQSKVIKIWDKADSGNWTFYENLQLD